MIRKIILSILGLLFFVYLASPVSPFENMWNVDARFIVKLIFNPIFLSIILLFFLIIWALIAFILSFFIKTTSRKQDTIESIFILPFDIIKSILFKN